MFYIIKMEDGNERGYVASKGEIVTSKKAAYPYRSYEEARTYRDQATKVHKLSGLKIVLR